MKKIYTLIATILTVAATVSAQQLPVANPDITTKDIGSFDGLWPECYPNGGTTSVGQQPTGWSASNIKQSIAEEILVEQGINRSENEGAYALSVNLTNKFCGLGVLGANAPAYITLGSAWNYGNMSGLKIEGDGGSYDGIEFTYRPDAISLWIKRTHGTSNTQEKASVILYSWKGETSSSVKVGFGSVQATTMINRDRDVLGMITEGVTASEDFELVSQSENLIEGDFKDWKQFVFDINYKTKTVEPEKLNIIISAANYFDDRANIGEGNYLNVDDVSLVYYSTLSELSIGGRKINLVDGQYNYEVIGSMPESEDDVAATVKGNFAEAKVSFNTEAKTVTISVTNQGGEDIDGKTEHVYTITYKDPISSNEYDGFLNINCESMPMISAVNQAAKVQIDVIEDGKCTFLLPDFTFMGMPVSSIIVENVTMSTAEDGITYKGSADGIELADGQIVANVALLGTINSNNIVNFDIDVTWLAQSNEGVTEIPIDVTFSSNKAVVSTESYDGFLNIEMGGTKLAQNEAKQIQIAGYGDNTCKFILPDFSLSSLGLTLGDIIVDDVTITTGDNITTYSGKVENMQFVSGAIVADVNINGTITDANVVDFKIDVNWHNEGNDIPIAVTFTSDKVYVVKEYNGYLNVEMDGILLANNQEDTINILQTDDNNCTFTLPDFQISLDGNLLPIGDIIVENVSMAEENGNTTYKGTVEGMKLMDGVITADVDINGTILADGKVDFKIDVLWVDNNLPIAVTFTSEKVEHVSIEGINTDNNAIYGTIGAININGYNGKANIYGITGQLVESADVDGNTSINIEAGIYIVRIADIAVKVMVK